MFGLACDGDDDGVVHVAVSGHVDVDVGLVAIVGMDGCL